jgi:hypothetical protein
LTAQSAAAAPVPARRLSVVDLVRQGDMSADSVTFARQSAYTPVAAAVAEATSVTTGTKPEASLPFAITTAVAGSYASWAPVTHRSLADAAEMRSLIDMRLLQDARQALETALLATVNTDAAQAQARSSDAHILAVLKALTLLRTAESEPSAIVVTPATYEAARSTVTSAFTAGPAITVDQSGEKWWGVPVIVSVSAPATVAFVANWRSAAAVWYRGADVFLSDSHDIGFTSNRSAVLAEVRAAHAVLAPREVVKITGM